ncbi:MAG: nucleotidyltransferase family protein [Rhodothermales bacterium]
MEATVHTKSELFERLREQQAAIRRLGVARLGVFGSFVRDEPTPESDVDIFVEFAPGKKTFRSFSALAELLEDVLQRRVELVTPESLSPYIGPYILREVEYVEA